MNNKLLYKPLYYFLILGLVFWILLYIIIPAKPTYSFSATTLIYIIVSFFTFFLGYFTSSRLYIIKTKPKTLIKGSKKVIWFLIIIVIMSWCIRYIDLFFSRGIAFSNTIQVNRDLMGTATSNPIFMFGAIFKELFFVPLLLTLIYFKNNKKLLLFSGFLYMFPLIVPFLRGTRKDVLLTFLLLAVVLLITRTITIKFKTILKVSMVFLLLNVVFFNLLMKREIIENQSKNEKIDGIIEYAVYNELLPPTKSFKERVKSSSGLKKAVLFNYVHTLQYYCHGLFELDYLVKEKIINRDYLNGQYNFNLFLKALEKLKIIEYHSNKIQFILPRQSTYITFLGALFVDFGWFAIIGMFLLGCFQNVIDKKVRNENILYLSLYVFFIVFNIFFPVINVLRGTGVYLVLASLTIILGLNILIKTKFRAYL